MEQRPTKTPNYCKEGCKRQPKSTVALTHSGHVWHLLNILPYTYLLGTGRLDPNPAALAYARLELTALEYWARQDEIILLYLDETVLWRFALPRCGWWRRHQRYHLVR